MSESHSERSLLSEKLRPLCFGDLTLPPSTSKRLQHMVDTMRPMNMVFYGPPGTGKTSAARLFTSAWEQFDLLQINGSLQTGVDFVRDRIEGFSRSPFATSDLRLCFIDEADYLSMSAQASLRVIIEQSEANCRFIFAVNDLDRIIAPLKSRLHGISFSIPKVGSNAVQVRLRNRLAERLTELGVEFDPARLETIISLYFPDFRRVATAIDFEFGA